MGYIRDGYGFSKKTTLKRRTYPQYHRMAAHARLGSCHAVPAGAADGIGNRTATGRAASIIAGGEREHGYLQHRCLGYRQF